MSTENQTIESNTLGDLFRETREKKGLTIQQVSDYLFITPSIITAIEASNRPSNINEVFWRGYIRSYAKHLNIETEQLKAFYAEPEQVDLDTIQKMRDYSQREVRRKQIKWLISLTSGVIVILLIIFIAWWHEHNLTTLKNASAATPSSATIDVPVTDSNGMPVQQNNQKEPTDVNEANPVLSNPPQNSDQATVMTPNASASESNKPIEPKVAQPLVSSSESSTSTHTNNSTVSTNNTQATQSKESIDAPALQISFSGDCWIKVTDSSTQKVLYAGLQSAGNQLSFQQPVGYDLIIGAPAMANVTYNGKTVDLASYSGPNKVAKFSLSPNN